MARGIWCSATLAVVVTTALGAACSSKSDEGGDGGDASGGSNAGTAGATSGGAGGVSGSAGTSTGGTLPGGGSGGGGSGGSGGIDACVGETMTGELVPLDLFLMLDISGSMLGETEDGSDKWTRVKQALTSFIRDPESSGLGVGIQYFPLLKPGVPATCTANDQCGANGPCFLKLCWGALDLGFFTCDTNVDCVLDDTLDLGPCVSFGNCANDPTYLCPNAGQMCVGGDPTVDLGACVPPESTCIEGYECNVAPYSAPAVPIAQLPDAADALIVSIGAQEPNGQTPTGPALDGAIRQAREYAAAHADHTVVALFATDGLPTECEPLEIDQVGAIARTGFEGTPSVRTFVIGVFGPEEAEAPRNLDVIAEAGGTEQAFIVDTSADVGEQFLAALAAIRGSKLACEFRIPAPTNGMTLDYGLVNVAFTENGATRQLFGVDGAGACGTDDGWYYDDPAMPTRIILCPSSCSAIQSGNGGSVEIELGCQTVVR